MALPLLVPTGIVSEWAEKISAGFVPPVKRAKTFIRSDANSSVFTSKPLSRSHSAENPATCASFPGGSGLSHWIRALALDQARYFAPSLRV